jgi:riboflavin kinase/FMN adenylyltransferase
MDHKLNHVPIYSQNGIVQSGTAVAREIGFPTANIRFEQVDISGTYAGKVMIEDVEYEAAVYANQKRQLLEAHLFDFSGDLYGKQITIILLERLAETKEFRGAQDERSFIEWAVSEVKKYFNQVE